MQNFHTFWLPGIQATGHILLPVGSAKGSFIDARDIAALAAALLTSEAWRNQDVDLTGPEAVDHDQVAWILSELPAGPSATGTSRPRRCAAACWAPACQPTTPRSCC